MTGAPVSRRCIQPGLFSIHCGSQEDRVPGWRLGKLPQPPFFSWTDLWLLGGEAKQIHVQYVTCLREEHPTCSGPPPCLQDLRVAKTNHSSHYKIGTNALYSISTDSTHSHSLTYNRLCVWFAFFSSKSSLVSPAWKKKGSVTPLSTGSDRASLKYHRGLPASSRPTCTRRQKVTLLSNNYINCVWAGYQRVLFSVS